MTDQDSFTDLMARLRAGDDGAAAAIFQRFCRRLLALARVRLEGILGHREDAEDVLQSVFRSFFRRHRDGQFELRRWGSLWALLAVITVRKCRNRIAYHHADRRDVNREVRLADGPAFATEQLLARDPTPAEAAALAETVDQVFGNLEARDRAILTLHLQGRPVEAISAEIGRSCRTVQRTLELIRKDLASQLADAAP
jgi:RNA polymerase sigma-70 factor (ECF subfamily)